MSKRGGGKLIVAFDGEMTGRPLCPRKYWMIALGASAVFHGDDGAAEEVDTFYAAMQPPCTDCGETFVHKREFQSHCKTTFWLNPTNGVLLKKFMDQAKPARDEMDRFVAWLAKLHHTHECMMVVCDSAFDAGWLAWYLANVCSEEYELPMLFGQYNGWPCITDCVSSGVLNTEAIWGLDSGIATITGVPSQEGTHHPQEDARAIAMNYANTRVAMRIAIKKQK